MGEQERERDRKRENKKKNTEMREEEIEERKQNWGQMKISMIKKEEKVVRKPKRQRTQETHKLGGMPNSQEKLITKTK
jgi:hypothetical protein